MLQVQPDEVFDSRAHCLDMLVEIRHAAMRTMFGKTEDKKLKISTISATPRGPPWVRGNYEVLYYCTVAKRWRNVADKTKWALRFGSVECIRSRWTAIAGS